MRGEQWDVSTSERKRRVRKDEKEERETELSNTRKMENERKLSEKYDCNGLRLKCSYTVFYRTLFCENGCIVYGLCTEVRRK